MIIIKLSGGLGNNMFQYASSRSLAISKKIPFSYFKVTGISFYRKSILRNIRKVLLGKEHFFQKQLSNKDLSDYFDLDQSSFKINFYRILWLLTKKKYKKFFFQNIDPSKYKNNELNIDKAFFDIGPFTNLSGPFASEKYFLLDRDKVLTWFKPNNKVGKKLEKLTKALNCSSEQRCCIHVRRGDAMFMDKGYDLDGLGWGLPLEYYKFIIKNLPKNLLFIFVSDDPLWVENNFSYLKNKVIYKNNSEIIDLLMFSKCKYNVIARSTFSWWGAWLNKIEDKVVYAPKYFIGIPKNICFPLGLDLGEEASSWNYINVQTLKKDS